MNTTNTTYPDQLSRLIALLSEMKDFNLRLVLSFEKIAVALAEIDDTYKRQVARQYPQRVGEIRDAVISRVPTEEDRVREAQGASRKPITDWLSEDLEADEQDIGVREREWLRNNARTEGLG